MRSGTYGGPIPGSHSWGFQAVAPRGHPELQSLLALPEGPRYGAFAFSVCQEGSDGRPKVRRCEDYRRSHHNDTIQVTDKPPHDCVDAYVSLIRRFSRAAGKVCVWGQDMWAAYRQYPIQHPQHAYLLLVLPWGISVWRHRVLTFGVTASVWHFNRAEDAIIWLARCFLLIPSLHFVDDVGGAESVASATSACVSFREFCELLGIRVKPSKEQLPAAVQKLLGVWIADQGATLEVRPHEGRRRRMVQLIQEILSSDALTPEVAARLAGKLGFLQTSLFGSMGKACLAPIHARASGNSSQANALNQAIRAALTTMLRILHEPLVLSIPLRTEASSTSIVYADAYFLLGDLMQKPGSAPVGRWPNKGAQQLRNGWGYVVRHANGVTFAHGDVPPQVVSLYSSRKAFIYFLEIHAQIIALLSNRALLGQFWISFIDNQAGRSALLKGFSKEPAVNNLLSFFWSLAAKLGWHGSFQYVMSDCNISDPVSRGDLTIPRHLGWRGLQTGLEDWWRLMIAIASDMIFATGEAVQRALDMQWEFQ